MPILHALQEAFGFIPLEAEPILAKTLNWSRAEVHGVVTFYHDFRRQPAGKHVLKLCSAEACQSMGSDHIAVAAEKLLGIKVGETTPDGLVTLEAVTCLAACDRAPMFQLQEGDRVTYHENMDVDRSMELIAALRAGGYNQNGQAAGSQESK